MYPQTFPQAKSNAPHIVNMINIIAAVARNRAIGYQNKLLYWLPNDLKRFKLLTTSHTIIMGRHTFESLPKGALPNRRNIILSRQKKDFRNAECYTSLQEALNASSQESEIFIIGGASVYAEALPYASRLCLTEIDDIPPQADAFFPELNPQDWKVTYREDHQPDERHSAPYSFVDYIRQQ